jgi:hypothetical protein
VLTCKRNLQKVKIHFTVQNEECAASVFLSRSNQDIFEWDSLTVKSLVSTFYPTLGALEKNHHHCGVQREPPRRHKATLWGKNSLRFLNFLLNTVSEKHYFQEATRAGYLNSASTWCNEAVRANKKQRNFLLIIMIMYIFRR